MVTRSNEVDEYIASFPKATQDVLQELRRRIGALAPDAVESISYGIITFKVGGKVLIHVGGFAHHVSVYPVPPTDDASLEAEIAKHRAGKGTLKFPLSEPVPYDFVERITRAHLDRLGG